MDEVNIFDVCDLITHLRYEVELSHEDGIRVQRSGSDTYVSYLYL